MNLESKPYILDWSGEALVGTMSVLISPNLNNNKKKTIASPVIETPFKKSIYEISTYYGGMLNHDTNYSFNDHQIRGYN